MASVAEVGRAWELAEMSEQYMRDLEGRRQEERQPRYAHDKQALYSHPYPNRYWCEDYRARLRWRVTPHPLHGRCFVLRPVRGLLHLGPDNDAGTYVAPGHMATLDVY